MDEDRDHSRIVGSALPIDYGKTASFFHARGTLAGKDPLTATMYQDADLARRRDQAEKERVLPLLSLRGDDRVLDLGCGSGRWAEAVGALAGAYLGIDFSEPLLDVARARFPGLTFQAMNVTAFDAGTLAVASPFSIVICSGILAYVNDADITTLFARLSAATGEQVRVYVREPMAKHRRLTLDRHWSEELQAHYSAIYRTRAEYLELFGGLQGFGIASEGEPFPLELQNRAETEQRYVLLHRQRAR